MRRRLFLLGWLLLISLAGCNLGVEDEEPIDEPTQIDSGRPTITINEPGEGDEFVVDEQLFVLATATDTTGVTRVQLFANGEIVKTVSSESLEGQETLNATLEYTPRAEGEVRLRVLAFRGSIASEPDEILINIVEEDDDITVTQRPGSSTGSSSTGSSTGSVGPVIPNDGVCRALTNVGLNLRNLPTTARDNVVTVLPSGTLVPIISRLGDNSWWKVSFNGTIGWVAASFTTIYGNCQSVPVELVVINTPTHTPTRLPTLTPSPTPTPSNTPVPGKPDFIITSLSINGEPATSDIELAIPEGESEITVELSIVITNQGAGSGGQFVTIYRIDDEETVEVGVVGNLGVNESVVLTEDIVFDLAGEYDIRVTVDPDDDVDEISDVNNRADATVIVVQQ